MKQCERCGIDENPVRTLRREVIETREVLAAAYRGRKGDRAMLSHAVVIDAHGDVIDVLCHRVEIDNLADRFASNPHVVPSCEICRKRRAAR